MLLQRVQEGQGDHGLELKDTGIGRYSIQQFQLTLRYTTEDKQYNMKTIKSTHQVLLFSRVVRRNNTFIKPAQKDISCKKTINSDYYSSDTDVSVDKQRKTVNKWHEELNTS